MFVSRHDFDHQKMCSWRRQVTETTTEAVLIIFAGVCPSDPSVSGQTSSALQHHNRGRRSYQISKVSIWEIKAKVEDSRGPTNEEPSYDNVVITLE